MIYQNLCFANQQVLYPFIVAIMSEATAETNSLRHYIDQLVADNDLTATELRVCLDTMITIYKNVVISSDEKFRRIKTSNHQFKTKVWKHWSAKSLLLNHGWRLSWRELYDGMPVIELTEDSKDVISHWIKVLIDYKMEVKPLDDQKSQMNKEMEEKRKEQELKQKGEEQRLKELKEFQKEYQRRKELAEIVNKELKANIKYRKDLNQFSK